MRKTSIQIFLLCLCCGCNLIDDGRSDGACPGPQSFLSLKFSDTAASAAKSGNLYSSIDTNSFILTIKDVAGNILYDGEYSKSPESLAVSPGSYNIKVVSENFSKPAFDKPQWGDEQTVLVSSGKNALVELLCHQMNCGVKMHVAPDFLTEYPASSLFLSSTEGKVMYGYSERRTAYFCPGQISLVMSTGGQDETVLTRSLESGQMLMLNISVPPSSDSGRFLSVQVDTTRTFLYEDFNLADGNDSEKGTSPESAYTILQARDNVGREDVWVSGYIVGGDLTKSSINFTGPFKSSSNMAIGPRSTTSSRESCMSVELKEGVVRDALNLVSNPSAKGRFVTLKGDIVSAYFGLVGLKNVTEYKLK